MFCIYEVCVSKGRRRLCKFLLSSASDFAAVSRDICITFAVVHHGVWCIGLLCFVVLNSLQCFMADDMHTYAVMFDNALHWSVT